MAWQDNKKLDGLYVYGPQNRNAFVHVAGDGWKLIWNQHDCQSEVLVVMAAHAKNESRPVKFFEENNKIRTLYVF